MNLMALAEQRFAQRGAKYKRRKAQAESRVADWHWATKHVWNLNPLYFEMNKDRPGRALAAKPARLNGALCYDTDKSGRIVVEREYTEVGPYERFYDWSKNQVEAAYFDNGQSPVNFQLVKFSGENVFQIATAALYGASLESFDWNGPLLTKIEIRAADRTESGLQKLTPYQEVHATYDTDGQVARVEVHWMPRPPDVRKLEKEVVYKRRDKPVSIDLRKDAVAVRQMLERAFAKYAARHAAHKSKKRFQPVTRIDLHFSLADGYATPWIALCLDCNADAGPGDSYAHPNFAMLYRKGWLPAVQTVCDGRKIEVTTGEGNKEKLGDARLTRAIGAFLVSALLKARDDGVFSALPLAERCMLGVEDPTTGAFGWPIYKDRGKDNLAEPSAKLRRKRSRS
jgi:hypothetical protein